MPRNSSGLYSLPQPPFVAGTVISSAAVNSNFSDIATALTGSLPTNGSTGMTGQLKVPDGSTVAPSYTFSNETSSGFSRVSAGVIGIDILGIQIGTITGSGITAPVQGASPIGSIIDFAGSTAPSQWYLCYGQAISRITYSSLFGIIGTTYGVGDGVTTFNLPDLRGNVTVGKENMGGVAAGRITSAYFGSDPTVLGDEGGIQDKTLITANLPPYTPAGAIANGAITINGGGVLGASSSVTVQSGNGSFGILAGPVNLNGLTASQAASSFTGSSQGGTSTPFATIQPSIIINKIIYAGA